MALAHRPEGNARQKVVNFPRVIIRLRGFAAASLSTLIPLFSRHRNAPIRNFLYGLRLARNLSIPHPRARSKKREAVALRDARKFNKFGLSRRKRKTISFTTRGKFKNFGSLHVYRGGNVRRIFFVTRGKFKNFDSRRGNGRRYPSRCVENSKISIFYSFSA